MAVVNMVRAGIRRMPQSNPIPCTICGAGLVEGVGVIGGKLRRDALVCGPCGRLGVRCTCASERFSQ